MLTDQHTFLLGESWSDVGPLSSHIFKENNGLTPTKITTVLKVLTVVVDILVAGGSWGSWSLIYIWLILTV